MKVEIFGSTDVGQVRDHNEDNFVLCKDLSNQDWTYKRDEQFDLGVLGAVLFVADGMGGTNAGEVASEIAQESVAEEFKKVTALPADDQAILSFVKKVVVRAHQNIVQRTHEDPTTAGMGTTAVVCWVVNDKAYVAWSGDSRMYLYRDGSEFYPITDDHSIVWELVRNGQLTPEEARLHENSNIITQSLGDEARGPKPDAKMVPLQQGDRVLLCSDGLSGMVSDNMLGGILSGRLRTAETCKELIQVANSAGGTDNITVLLLDVIEGKAGVTVSNKPNASIKTAVSKNGGNAPINTVASKEGPNKVLIIGVMVVLAIIAAVVFFILKPGQGEVGQDSNDTLVNPIDTPALNNLVIDTPPASVIEPTQVNAPATTTTNSQTNNTAPSAPTKPPVTGSNTNNVTNGGNEKPVDNISPKTTAPKDTTKPSGINVNLPKDTAKNNTPGGLTPRKQGPNLPKGGLNPDGGK
jgi:protein phosphatase